MLAIIAAASLVAGSHVRSDDAVIGAAFRHALLGSTVIQRLVDVIDASDVIVYLASGRCPKPAIACVMMGGGGAGTRYVRINFVPPIGLGRRGGWFRDELSVAIAHELQHAAEIATWPEVIDAATLQAAYRRRGFEQGWAHLDTDAAIQAGDERRAELRRGRRR